MKNNNIILVLVLLITTSITYAQQSIFEAIEANGEDATYIQYGSIYKKDDGSYDVQSKLKTVNLKLYRTLGGIPMGVHVIDVATNKRIDHKSEEYKNVLMDNYAAPAFLRDINYYDAFLMVDNMMFEIDRLQDDGSYRGIDAIYVLEGTADTSTKEEKPKKKKGFFNKLKDKVADTYGKDAGRDDNQKMLATIDLENKIATYFAAMKSRQARESSALAKSNKDAIWGFKHNKYTKLNRHNDSLIKNDPGYRKAYQDRLNGGVANGQVSLKNTTGSDVLIISGESNTSKMSLSSGQSKNWNCYSDAYIGRENNDGSSTTYTAIKKIYSAKSKCEGTVSF